MERETVDLMNEFLRDYIEDMEYNRAELAEVKALTSKNQPEAMNVMTLIIYMYKKTKPSREEILKELADSFIGKILKFDLKEGDEKFLKWIKEYRSSKIDTADNAGRICSGLRLFVEWIDLVIKFKSQFY